MSIPTVSVVVPTFCRPVWLAQSLASLAAQTFTDFEAIVCDNANDPKTRAVVDALGDERFRYVGRPENIGMVPNVLEGFREAVGEFHLELDDDDILHPEFLAALVTPLRAHPEAALAVCCYEPIDEAGEVMLPLLAELRRVKKWDQMCEGAYRSFTSAVVRGSFQLYSGLIRADAVDWQAIPAEVEIAFDTHVLLTAAENCGVAWFVPRTLLSYRIHDATASQQTSLIQVRGALTAFELARGSGRHIDTDCLDRAISRRRIDLAGELARAGRGREARRLVRQAVSSAMGLHLWHVAARALLPAPVVSAGQKMLGSGHHQG